MFHTFGRPNANGLKPELISDVQKRRFHHRLQAKPRFSWKYAQRLDGSIILHSCKFQKQQKCCTVSKFRCWIEIEFVEASRENPFKKNARLRVCETLTAKSIKNQKNIKKRPVCDPGELRSPVVYTACCLKTKKTYVPATKNNLQKSNFHRLTEKKNLTKQSTRGKYLKITYRNLSADPTGDF